MKKILCLILAIVLTLSFASCGKSESQVQQNGSYGNSGNLVIDGIASNSSNKGGLGGWLDSMFGNSNNSQSPSSPSFERPDIYIPEDNENQNNTTNFENTFVSTKYEPVSTFSADVDTASYTYFRNLVESGYNLKELQSTAGNTIRTEEMINYFNYNYPAPNENELFSKNVQIAPTPWNSNSQLVVIGLQAKEAQIASKNNLVFLIDVSGSMNSEDKLQLLQKAFSYLVDQLNSDDTISIVTYSGSEKVVLDGCSGAKKDKIMNAINSLVASGSTNGESGLKKAYQLAEKHFISDGNNRIIMASDGDLNVGISSVEEIKEFIEDKRDAGVFLSVLGFGMGNYKDSTMETIADCGNGVYYYIDNETEAEKVFGTDIFATLYTIAKDVKIQLSFNSDYISQYRLIGYENRILNNEDFENDTKDAGELGSGHSVTVCYEVVFTNEALKLNESAEFMKLSVRYKNPDGIKSNLEEKSFGINTYTNTPDENFKFICCVIETSMLLHKSEYWKDGNLDKILETARQLKLYDEYKTQFVDLLTQLNQK